MLELTAVLTVLCTRGVFLASKFSAGPNTPAVTTEDTPSWVVLNLQGSPVAFTHNAFDAARLLVALENEGPEALFLEPGEVLDAGPTDAVQREWELEESRERLQLMGYL
jgi:hypothetical protein